MISYHVCIVQITSNPSFTDWTTGRFYVEAVAFYASGEISLIYQGAPLVGVGILKNIPDPVMQRELERVRKALIRDLWQEQDIGYVRPTSLGESSLTKPLGESYSTISLSERLIEIDYSIYIGEISSELGLQGKHLLRLVEHSIDTEATEQSRANTPIVDPSQPNPKNSSNLRFSEFPKILASFLRETSHSQLLGVSGLAILCASSVLALMPASIDGAIGAVTQWLGGLGLNALAGALYDRFQHLKGLSEQQDRERLNQLAKSLSNDIRAQGELRIEVGRFLNDLDAFRIAEEVVSGNPAVCGWLLLQIYKDVSIFRNDFDQIHEVLAGIKNSIANLQIAVDAFSEDSSERSFSKNLTDQFEFLNKAIKTLTEDQYGIIQFLRGRSRVAISGCAGSGKTLVALEKAIRLDSAGFRTLLLCHSPYLAQHLRGLAANSGLIVYDFSAWIRSLQGKNETLNSEWSHFEEPLDAELDAAFDRLDLHEIRYDAIIVDEGQDFRESWWIIVEAALASLETGILYVFHDDNQALLTRNLAYPVKEAPFSISKNCRNGGEIFEVVRRFHEHAPDPSVFLEGQGRYRLYPYLGKQTEIASVQTAIQDALSSLQPNQITVLTTEESDIRRSVLNGVEVANPVDPRDPRWQDAVNRYLGKYVSGPLIFSDGMTPTENDISNVTRRARDALIKLQGSTHLMQGLPKLRWRPGHILTGYQLAISPRRLLSFFADPSWADELPENLKVYVTAFGINHDNLTSIPLYTLSGFKGLESDGIVLYIHSPADVSKTNLYVGLSRAKVLLCVVASLEIISREPLLLKDNSDYDLIQRFRRTE